MSTSTAQRDQLLDLIGSIYDAALRPAQWPQVIAATASLMRSTRALMLTPFHGPDDGGIFVPRGIPETFMQQYASRYIEHDIWAQRGAEQGVYVEGNVALDTDILPRQEFLESIFYREFLSHMDIMRLCAGVVFGQESAAPTPTNIAIFRGLREPDFDAGDKDLLRLLLPHVSRALGIHLRLRDAELRSALSLAALDRLSSGVVLIGSRGQVIHLNRSARHIILAQDGLLMKDGPEQMVLTATKTQETRDLHAAIALALRPNTLEVPHFSRGVRVTRPSGRQGYVLNLAPLPPNNEFSTARDTAHVIIFVLDPSAPVALDPALLKKLYCLTPAEIRVAQCVCAGETTTQAAKTIGVAETTIRTQLNSILAKTETRRQSELVKLLASIGSTTQTD